ncbi:MAG: M20 family metallopeptidase [Anaerolineales bacterium]|nr:M20 family metallopeptidase [Anaerolineales bacterium]
MDLISVERMESYLPGLLDLVEHYVMIESPSTEKEAVDQLVTAVAEDARELNAELERRPQSDVGDQLIARWPEQGPGGVLLLTHLDTVHPLGTLDKMGSKREGRKWIAPGIFDMKTSIAMALTAIDALRKEKGELGRSVTLLCTSDEEIGSQHSRTLIEDLAQEHKLVLCLEPALADGALKTRRKGIGIFEIEVIGQAAHAGVAPEEGANAILEMSRQVIRLAELQDHDLGISVNVGTIEGGTRSNVVPDYCRAEVDVRIQAPDQADRLERAIMGLEPNLAGAQVRVKGGWNRPPMPRTSAIADAFHQAQAVASELGFDLAEGWTGGGSDANFIAPLGMPLLDGLGPIGGAAHSHDEFIWIDSLPRRTALLAGLIREFE